MRLEDMVQTHPLMSRAYTCDRCNVQLGIYPSGQAMIRRYGRDNFELVCNRCQQPEGLGLLSLEALSEIQASIPNPEKGKN